MASSSGNSDRWIHRSGSLGSAGIAFANAIHPYLIIILLPVSRVTASWSLMCVAKYITTALHRRTCKDGCTAVFDKANQSNADMLHASSVPAFLDTLRIMMAPISFQYAKAHQGASCVSVIVQFRRGQLS